MTLDVPTILVALILATALSALILAFARPALANRVELRPWVWANWSLLGGYLGLASRVVVPEWLSVLLGNGLLFVTLLLISQALHRFVLQRSAPRWHVGLAVAGWLCTALLLDQSVWLRTTVLSIVYLLQLLPSVVLLLRHGWHAETSLRTVAVTLGLMAFALGLRVAHILVQPDEYQAFFQASLGNGLTYLATLLCPLAAGFGFVLANLERVAARLSELATRDVLTGCANRAAFDELLQHALERARREKTALSLLLLDLDDFKKINDGHGHQAGDAVLRAFCSAVRGRLRASDVLARLGGDEFAILLIGTPVDGAVHVAEVLRRTIESVSVDLPNGVALRVTSSLGLAAVAPGEPISPDDLMARADRSLYQAKQAGRNRAGVIGA